MSNSETSDFVEMREEIVAYLDGELSPEQTAAVEARLANDDGYRHELLQLQRTWDMLDQMPRTTASMDFTRSTVEMAAIKEQKVQRRKWFASMNWQWIAAGVAIVCFGALGYAISFGAASKPNRDLERDLELLGEFELFEEVDSIEYLKRLQLKGLFANEVARLDGRLNGQVMETDADENSLDPSSKDGSELNDAELSPVTVNVAEMDNGQLYQLKLKKDKFDGLSENERSLYRELHARLNAHPDRDQLQQVLTEYNNWLSSVEGKARAELVQLPLDERVDRVSEILRRQAEDRLKLSGDAPLDSDDITIFRKWLGQFLANNLPAIQELAMEIRKRSGRYEDHDSFNTQRGKEGLAILAFVIRESSEDDLRKIFTPDDIDSLSSTLSEKGGNDLKQAIDENRFVEFLRGSMRASWQMRTPVSEEQLQEFFEQQLSADQQSKMDWMAPDVRHRVLTMAYWMWGPNDFAPENRTVPEDWDPKRWARGPDGRRGPPDGKRGPDSRGSDGRGRPPGSGKQRATERVDSDSRSSAVLRYS